MLPVTSLVELIEEVVEIVWVVLTESKMLLTLKLDKAASAGKTNKKEVSIEICLKDCF